MMPSKPISLRSSNLKQFSLNNDSLQVRDAMHWAASLSEKLTLYCNSCAASSEDLEAKAAACASLAGLGLAMHNHFGAAVEALGCAEHQSCLAAGLAAFDSGKAHTDKMEAAALRTLN